MRKYLVSARRGVFMKILVQKFGGTSLGSIERIKQAGITFDGVRYNFHYPLQYLVEQIRCGYSTSNFMQEVYSFRFLDSVIHRFVSLPILAKTLVSVIPAKNRILFRSGWKPPGMWIIHSSQSIWRTNLQFILNFRYHCVSNVRDGRISPIPADECPVFQVEGPGLSHALLIVSRYTIVSVMPFQVEA